MIKNKIDGKIYIGQTTRPIEERFKNHRTKSGCRLIYRAIKKYGWGAFEKDYYECPDEDLNFDEELLVREMDTLMPEGYDLREGGGSNGKHSEETKQKIREATRGKKLSEETKQKMRKPKSEVHRRNIGKAHIGKTRSDEAKQNMSEAQIGKTLSDNTKKRSVIQQLVRIITSPRECINMLSTAPYSEHSDRVEKLRGV